MKKLIIMLLVVATLAAMTVNCFAASTAVTDLDLVYFDDFSDSKKQDYGYADNYIAEVEGDALFIQPVGSSYQNYLLPGAPEITGLDKMTVAYRFKYETLDSNKAIGICFSSDDQGNFYFAGINFMSTIVDVETEKGTGVKAFYAPITANKAVVEGKSTRRWQYQSLVPTPSSPVTPADFYMYNGDDWFTVIVELEVGKNPTYTFYTNDQKITTFGGDWHGGGSMPDGSDYEFATDAEFNLNGLLGFCRVGSGVYLDGVACYKNTGLDTNEIAAKLASEGGATGGDAPATEAPTTEAPVTEAPVTEAPTTDAPVTEAPATEAPETEAPATDAPATDAPATDAPTTEAPKDDKGCGGVIGVGAIVAILGTAVVLKKRD